MNLYEKIIEKYDLEPNEENMVLVVPHNRYEWHVARNDEIGIQLSLEDIACLSNRFAQFNEKLTGIEDFNSKQFKAFIESKTNN